MGKMDNCDKILSQLNNITDDNVLIIKCNNIAQQSVINILVIDKGYSTIPISCDNWRENFVACPIYDDYQWDLHFGSGDWESDQGAYYDYRIYGNDRYEGAIIYHHDKNMRLLDYSGDDDIVDLEYNAIVIYPSYWKMKYVGFDEFMKRKNAVHKNHYISQVTNTSLGCRAIINNIHEFETLLCSKNNILNGYDVRKILLLREIVTKNSNIEDILILIYNVYYICNNS
jgi:hypothetical protein